MGRAGFAGYAVPVFVVLDKAFLDIPFGEEIVDISLALSVVAGVDTDPLAKQFLDGGLELRAVVRQVETFKCDVGGLQAPG